MKAEKMVEARRLRKEIGMSVKEIADNIGVSKGSVSRWVRGIVLSDDQIASLLDRNPAYNNQIKGKNHYGETCRNLRLDAQNEGRERAKLGDSLHLMGCMLYWAEGDKHKNRMKFSNSDPEMMRVFASFLRQSCGVKEEEMTVNVNCYSDKSSVENSENFWLGVLSLKRENLRKTLVDYDKRGKSSPRKKHLHGVCSLVVHSTELVQRIFGAIQEYGGFVNSEWINAVYGAYQEAGIA